LALLLLLIVSSQTMCTQHASLLTVPHWGWHPKII
jgi:hypothetical protein